MPSATTGQPWRPPRLRGIQRCTSNSSPVSIRSRALVVNAGAVACALDARGLPQLYDVNLLECIKTCGTWDVLFGSQQAEHAQQAHLKLPMPESCLCAASVFSDEHGSALLQQAEAALRLGRPPPAAPVGAVPGRTSRRLGQGVGSAAQ
jgi:hypothetical protein